MKAKIYTDGACSKNPGPGGWALMVSKEHSCESRTGNELNTTNNRMELTAVFEALKYILNSNKSDYNEFEVISDSAYVVNAINNGWIKKWRANGWKTSKGDEVKNVDLWQGFIKLMKAIKSKDIRVSFIKIKGHNGNTFNEFVDELAKFEVIKAKRQVEQHEC